LGGRFTSVDPVMQAPFSSQGLNRYSYVFNDPINNTDPSGFDSTAWDVVGGIFTTGVVGLLCYGTGDCSGATLGSAASAASGGASVGLPFLSGFAGAARPGMSYSVAPTATPKSSSGSPGTTQVLGQLGQPGPAVSARRPPRLCDAGICLSQSTPGGEGGPGVESRNDGTGGTAKPSSAAAAVPLVLRLPTVAELVTDIAEAWQVVEGAFAASAAAPAVAIGSVSVIPGDSVIVQATGDSSESSDDPEHTKNARKSTQQKHEDGAARKLRDRGGEKGDDARDPPRRRPKGYRGPWPPR